MEHVLDIRLSTGGTIYTSIICLLSRPASSFKKFIGCFKKAKEISISPVSRFISALKIFYFIKKIEHFKNISLIHSHEEICGYTFLHLSKYLDIPMVLTFHGLPPAGVGQLAKLKRDILYKNVLTVLVNTEFAKQQVIGLGASEESIHIIPQGLPLEDFPFVPMIPPKQSQAIELLTIGRFHHDKGQRYALLALKRLLDSGYNAKWHFVGVGSGVEELKQFSARLNISEHAHFHVGLSDTELKKLYQQCHIFSLCSVDNAVHIETQGVVIQEAQASGCLVIATNVGGVPECIHDYEDGLLIKPKSSKALYEAICYFQNNHDIWDDYLRKGRANVENNFSADVIGKRMAGILKTVNFSADAKNQNAGG